MAANYVTLTSDKSKKVAFFWCILGGYLGLHYFYVGRIGRGLVAMFTLNFFLLGWLRDLHRIRVGKFTDNVGQPLRH